MALDDLCNTTLVLGLGLTINTCQKKINKPVLDVRGDFEPCFMSLGLSDGPYGDFKDSVTCSAQSGGVVKREREVVGSEEVDTARVSSKASNFGSNSITKKLKLNEDQSVVLEENFKLRRTLYPKQKQELARKLNLGARQIEVWFQNRRARTKVKQNEVAREYLKKCYETLTEENGRLKKDLRELKALKLARPLYTHMPVSTLAMCSSCNTIDKGDHFGEI